MHISSFNCQSWKLSMFMKVKSSFWLTYISTQSKLRHGIGEKQVQMRFITHTGGKDSPAIN